LRQIDRGLYDILEFGALSGKNAGVRLAEDKMAQ